MKPINSNNHSTRIEYSDEDECFVGRVAGIKDIITFHGESVQETPHHRQLTKKESLHHQNRRHE